ncbi:hypothetical protein MMPV_008893 [Pyropia vietnamensis]
MRLATVAPDGSNGLSLELESGGGLLLQPTWSPDGAYVAVADVRLPMLGTKRDGGGALASAAAYVVILSALDGTEVRRVRVSPPPFYFQWSADGSLLTFLHNEPVLPSSAEAGGGGLPSSPPRRSRRVRASVVSAAPGADTDAVPFAGGHPLYYAMSPEGGKALVYAGDDRKVSVYDLAAGPVGGAGVGGVPSPQVLSRSSGALATPQWLPRPHRQATAVGSAAESAVSVAAADDDEPLVLLLEDVRPVDVGAGGRGASDTFSAGSPPQALVLMSATDPSRRRVLGRFWGHVRYAVAPGGGRLAVLVTNPLSGREELSVIEGPFTLDPPGGAGGGVDAYGGARGGAAIPADAILSNPANRAVAFFWSPDGRRLLFLTTPRNGAGGNGGVIGGAARNALYAWAVFDAVTGRVARFVRHRLPTVGPLLLSFFDQHARSTTFWAPDSASFVYAGIPVEEGEEAAVGEAAGNAGAATPAPAGAVSDSEARWLRGSGGSGGTSSAGGASAPLPPMRSAAAPAAFVQTLPAALMDATLPRADLVDAVEPPRRVADGVQYTSWSPC